MALTLSSGWYIQQFILLRWLTTRKNKSHTCICTLSVILRPRELQFRRMKKKKKKKIRLLQALRGVYFLYYSIVDYKHRTFCVRNELATY